MNLLMTFRYWRFKRMVKKAYRLIPLIDGYMLGMNYSRQQRKHFWRAFVKDKIDRRQ